jgi:hypothetical protein
VREAVLNGKWISGIAYNLNAGILNEFFELWQLINSLHLDLTNEQEDHII